jgi:hypothetical protein
MSKLDEILEDLESLTGVMTDAEIEKATAAVAEAQYHGKAIAACMARIMTVIDSVQSRNA